MLQMSASNNSTSQQQQQQQQQQQLRQQEENSKTSSSQQDEQEKFLQMFLEQHFLRRHSSSSSSSGGGASLMGNKGTDDSAFASSSAAASSVPITTLPTSLWNSQSDFMKSVDSFVKQFQSSDLYSHGGGSMNFAKNNSSSDPDLQQLLPPFFTSSSSSASSTDNYLNSFKEFLISKSSLVASRDNDNNVMLSQDWVGRYEDEHIDIDPSSVFSQSLPCSQEQHDTVPAHYKDDHDDNDDPKTDATKPRVTASSTGTRSAGADAAGGFDWAAYQASFMPRPQQAQQQLDQDDRAPRKMPPLLVDEHEEQQQKQPQRKQPPRSTNSSNNKNMRKRPTPDATVSTEAAAAATVTTTTRGNKKNKTTSTAKEQQQEQRMYYTPRDADVLCGRGGRTNHHKGNKAYLQEKERLQQRYLAASKTDKTDISQELVDFIKLKQGGRFLDTDDRTGQWYEISDLKARKKAAQTLRELNTPEERRSKRERYGK